MVCAACHLFPEPSLLEYEAWEKQVLPRMGLFMGMEKPVVERMHNPELLTNSSIFQTQPMISRKTWDSIGEYYRQNAPKAQPRLKRGEGIADNLELFKARELPFRLEPATTTFVGIQKSTHSILFADAKTETLYDVSLEGKILESITVSNIVTSVKYTGTYRFIAGIGDFFPSDDRFGQVFVQQTAPEGSMLLTIGNELPRAVNIETGDFNGDGKVDFALCVFGNLLGRYSWFENKGNGYEEHILFNKPGAVKSIAYDFDRDGNLDLAVLVAQATESLMIYFNDGHGNFKERVVFQKPPTYGHTDFQIADFNEDGQMDFLVANGDNADFQSEPRPYNGLRIYLAAGEDYKEAMDHPFYGAYGAVVEDFDGDGDKDIAAISFFPDCRNGAPETFVYLENKGSLQFESSTFKNSERGRWLRIDAGDFDGDGDIDIVLGALVDMPDQVPIEVKEKWALSPSVLVLENMRIH